MLLEPDDRVFMVSPNEGPELRIPRTGADPLPVSDIAGFMADRLPLHA